MDTDLLQQAFARALTDTEAAVPRGVIATPARFNIHRNNMVAGLEALLASRYPVIQRLVGEPFFAATARAFIAADPPRSPVLLEYGAAFAPFLAGFEPAAPYPYLPDIARLDWARHCAYHAADAPPADLSRIAALDPERMSRLRFNLHPSATVIASAFPILSIWRTNSFDAEVTPITLDGGGETALIVRPHLEVITTALPPGSDSFTAALTEGAALGDAANAAAEQEPVFDLTATLAALFRAQAFAMVLTTS
jgi:Putative DNA-binding domain